MKLEDDDVGEKRELKPLFSFRSPLISRHPLAAAPTAPHFTTLRWTWSSHLIMVLLATTDRILIAFGATPTSRREELDLPSTLELHEPIAHEQLIRLAKELQTDTEYKERIAPTPTVLSFLLRGTKVYVPPPPKKPEPVRIVNHNT